MKDALVGYTGFVGSNLAAEHCFEGLYNSANIQEAFGTNPDLLVYAGVPAEMFLANHYPEKDFRLINIAIENIRRINPKNIVLISSIAVYDNPVGVDEDTNIDLEKLTTYGKDRRLLEMYVEENFTKYLIVRLPALFGKNLKKNFIYDFIHIIPGMLTASKFNELLYRDGFIKNYYDLQNNGFYKVKGNLSINDQKDLKSCFKQLGFSALNFTDSRSTYQFYNLAHLWTHIKTAINNDIHILNTATEPIMISKLYYELTGEEFTNKLDKAPYNYNYYTKYSDLMNSHGHYIFSGKEIIEEIKRYIENNE